MLLYENVLAKVVSEYSTSETWSTSESWLVEYEIVLGEGGEATAAVPSPRPCTHLHKGPTWAILKSNYVFCYVSSYIRVL